MAAKDNKKGYDENDNPKNYGPTSSSLAPFPCENFQHDGDGTIHVTVVYKSSSSMRFTSSTIPTRSTRTGQLGSPPSRSDDTNNGNELFFIFATLNGLDTIAQSTQRIVENHCPWLLDELSEEEDVLVRYGDANRAQRRQQNIDQQPIINVHLSNYNSDTKNIFSPAAITRDVLKCGSFVSFLYDYRLLMRPPPLVAATAATSNEVSNNDIREAKDDKLVSSTGSKSVAYTMEFLTTLSLNQLKELCKVKRVTVSGPKKDLIDRLLKSSNVQDDSAALASEKCLITQQNSHNSTDNTDVVVCHQKGMPELYNQQTPPGMDTPKAGSSDSIHVPDQPPATTSVVDSIDHVHQVDASRSLNHGTKQIPKQSFAHRNKSNSKPTSESHSTTSANMNVTSLPSEDSLPPQQQLTLVPIQKMKKKSRKSSHERVASNDPEAQKKKSKTSSNFNLHLPPASTAQELTPQSSNPTTTINLPTELQTTSKSAVAAEKKKNAVDEPMVQLPNLTTTNGDAISSTSIAHQTPPNALNSSNKTSSGRKNKVALQQQRQAIEPLNAAPIAALHVPKKSSVTASAVASNASSRLDKSRQTSSQSKIISSNLPPAVASTAQDRVVTSTTKLPMELKTSFDVALEAKKRRSAADKSSDNKELTRKTRQDESNPEDKVRNTKSASSTPATKQTFHATSNSTHVPVPTMPNAAPSAVSYVSKKYGTGTSVVNSTVDVHLERTDRSSYYETQLNTSNTHASSEKSECALESHGTTNANATSLHPRDSLPPEQRASLSAIQKSSKNRSRKSSSEQHIAPNEALVPKKKPKTSSGINPILSQSASASKGSVASEKRKNIVAESPKKKKKRTRNVSDVNISTEKVVTSNQTSSIAFTQPSLLVASRNGGISDSNQKDKDAPYPQQQRPTIEPLKVAPIAPTPFPETLVATPSFDDASAPTGNDREKSSVLHREIPKQATPKHNVKGDAQTINRKHVDSKTLTDNAVFSNMVTSTTIVQPSHLAAVMNTDTPDSQQKGESFSFPQKEQLMSDPPEAIPIASSRIPDKATFAPLVADNSAFSSIVTSKEGFSEDTLTTLTKNQLRELCKISKIPHSGPKKALVDRLMKNKTLNYGGETNPPVILNTDDKKLHSERETSNTYATAGLSSIDDVLTPLKSVTPDALKDTCLMSSKPIVREVRSTTLHKASLLHNNQQQSMANKEKNQGDSTMEGKLASPRISPIITANDMVQSGRQIDSEDLPLKLPTNTDLSNNIMNSDDWNTMDGLLTLTSAQLKALCNTRKIPHSGTKKALIDRLIKNGI